MLDIIHSHTCFTMFGFFSRHFKYINHKSLGTSLHELLNLMPKLFVFKICINIEIQQLGACFLIDLRFRMGQYLLRCPSSHFAHKDKQFKKIFDRNTMFNRRRFRYKKLQEQTDGLGYELHSNYSRLVVVRTIA
jgi:hypothetical protein